MHALSCLRRLMAQRPMPVIIVSSLTQSGSSASLEALQAGAIDVIPKPGGPYSVGQGIDKLKERMRALRLGASLDVIPTPGGPYSVGRVIDKLKERIRALRMGPAIRYQKPATVAAPPP